MMRCGEVGQGEQAPISPRSDSSDSQWCLLSPGLKHPGENSTGSGSGVAPSSTAAEFQDHLELHPVPDEHPEDSSDSDATHEESGASTPTASVHGEDDNDEVQKRWNQAELYAADLRRASTPSPPKMRASYSTRYFKILVAGAPASGKTTFIQNLASSYGHEDAPEAASPGIQHSPLLHSTSASEFVESFSTEPTTLEDFKDAPDSLCTRVLFTDEAAKTNYRLLIQDTPGYHEAGAETEAILGFIYKGNVDYMASDMDKTRPVPMSALEDTRCDVCLYFVAPHSLRPLDISMMARIGCLVPVVPIIAKGDTLTRAELEQFREAVAAAVKAGAPGSPAYAFPPEDAAEAGFERPPQVFSVISSCVVDASMGGHWPVRSYPWGVAEALHSTHSDVPALKRLLIELSFEGLKARTEQRYYAYRAQRLAAPPHPPRTSSPAVLPPQPAAALLAPKCEAIPAQAPPAGVKPQAAFAGVTPAVVAPSQPRPARQATRPSTKAEAEAVPWWGMCAFIFAALVVNGLFFYALYSAAYHVVTWVGGNAELQKAYTLARPMEAQQQHLASEVGICLDGLNLSGHQVAGRTRHKELWALVHLAQEMGKQKDSTPLCAQERGILAYQGAQAKAELESVEAIKPGPLRTLSTRVKKALRAQSLHWKKAMRHSTANIGHAINGTMHRLAHKMPLKVEKQRLTVDLKALRRIAMRTGAVAMWL